MCKLKIVKVSNVVHASYLKYCSMNVEKKIKCSKILNHTIFIRLDENSSCDTMSLGSIYVFEKELTTEYLNSLQNYLKYLSTCATIIKPKLSKYINFKCLWTVIIFSWLAIFVRLFSFIFGWWRKQPMIFIHKSKC